MTRISLDNPGYYLNRDTSWMAFNRRVLEEAEDEGNPLLERLKFLSISASNLDEFFEVRVAGMMQQIEDGYNEAGPDGVTLTAKRDILSKLTHEFVDDQYDCWNSRLRPALSTNGIRVLGLHELDADALRFVEEYCEKELDPLLTPVTVDPSHPFPRVINKALCLGLLLRRRRRSALTYTGVVSVPRALPRLVRLPSQGTDDFIFLADLVAHHAVRMYHGYDIVSSAPFRVTRNSNLYLAEEEARSLLESVRTELHNRRKGDAVRLEIEGEYSIPSDSRVELKSGSLLGGMVADIVPGPATTFLRGGETMPGTKRPGPFDNAGDIADQAEKTLTRVQALLSQKTVENVEASSVELNGLLKQLSAVTAEQRKELIGLTASLRKSAEGMEKVTTGPELQNTVKRLDALTQKLDGLTASLDRSSHSMETILGRIERGEGTLGKFSKDDTLYLNASEAMANVNNAVVEMRKLTEDIRKEPKKFLRLSFF